MFFLRLVVCVRMYEKEIELGGEEEEEEKEMWNNDNHNLLNYLFNISFNKKIFSRLHRLN